MNQPLDLTFDQVLAKVQERRPCAPATLRRYFRKLKIQPLGTGKLRTKPHRFPLDTPDRILSELGLKIVTLNQLRAERTKAQKARAA